MTIFLTIWCILLSVSLVFLYVVARGAFKEVFTIVEEEFEFFEDHIDNLHATVDSHKQQIAALEQKIKHFSD